MPFPRAAGLRKSLGCHVLANRVLLLLLFASVAALAQSSSRNPALIYQEAILEKQTSKRILALEQFASTETADPLRADAMETLTCGYLSWILLAGLALNAVTHWWWIDSIASLAIVPLLIREGWEAIFGEQCC